MTDLLANGFAMLSLASIFVLVALGLHFTFGLLGIVNLAHGELILVGAYVTFFVQQSTGSVLLGMLVAPFAAGLLGLLLERSLLRLFYERPLDSLLVTFGLSIIIRQGVQLIWSAVPREVARPLSGQVSLLGVTVASWRVLLIVLVAVVVAAIHLCVNRTSLGLRARAAVTNPELARTRGIDVDWVRAALFAVGAGLAGLAGAVLAPLYTVDPQFGVLFLVNAFLVVMLGRPGSLRGAVAGGVALGVSLALLQLVTSTVAAQMLVLVIAVLGVRLRPLVGPAWAAARRRRAPAPAG